MLDDTLVLGPGTLWSAPAVLGAARAVIGMTLLGVGPGTVALPPDALVLAGGDVALRRPVPARRLEHGDLPQVRADWRRAVLA